MPSHFPADRLSAKLPSMKMPTLAVLLLLITTVSALHAADAPATQPFKLPAPDAEGWVHPFNGKNLDGWWGDMNLYKAVDGEIVGKTETGIKANEFLKSRFELGDFKLVLQIKLVPNGANSGVQFRSQPQGGNEMKGYQADSGAGWWGKLYEESGRGLLTKEDREGFLKKEEYNTYEIIAVGDKIRTALNGNICVDIDDPKGDKKGLLGLQVHAGGPTEVHFKDIKIQLDPKDSKFTTVKE